MEIVKDNTEIDNIELSQTEEETLKSIVIIEETEGAEKYRIKGKFSFGINISDGDDNHTIEGMIMTNAFLDQTEIYNIHNWRYELLNIRIGRIDCISDEELIVYRFTAQNFDVKA